MNPSRLLQHFDRLSEAPDAVPRLRQFILDLAVRGKLVEQDPTDEPASELLKRTQAKDDKKGPTPRRQGTKKAAEAKEEPRGASAPWREIPASWMLVRFDEVAIVAGGVTLGRKLAGRRSISLPYLRVANVQRGELDLTVIKEVSIPEDELERYVLRENDLLMTEGGDWDKVGRAAIWRGEIPCCLHQNHVFRVRMRSSELVPRWFELYFNSPTGRGYFESASKQTTNLASINMRQVRGCLVPLPPQPEQHRIVAKVDELMGLCDRLEAAQSKREQRRDRLVAASLQQLQSSEGLTQRRKGAKKEEKADREKLGALAPLRESVFLQNLPRLTTRPEHIKALRQTILNLAVRGRLVPQDPKDEPIDVSLRALLDRRASLVRAKKIRQKKLDELAALTKRRDLPASWTVDRLGNLVDPENTISYGVLVPGKEVADGVPFVRAQDLALNSHPERPNKSIAPEIEKAYARTRLQGGEILLCVVGSIGKLGVVPPSWAGANIARAVARILPVPEVFRDYLLVVLQAKPLQTYFAEATRTLAQPTLNVGLIEQAPIPLPPFAEQQRIVAKVDELMSLCDQLEAQLITTQTDSRRLLEAVLHEALA